MPQSRLVPLAALLVLASSLHLQAQFSDEGSIIVELSVARGGFPTGHVLVQLETRGAIVGQTFSDDEGKLAFYFLKANLYHVTINDNDYEPVSRDVPLNPSQNHMEIVHIDLVPKSSDAASPFVTSRPGANAHMMDTSVNQPQQRNVAGNPYLTNPAEYNRQFPKEAVKEFDKGGESSRKGKFDDAIRHYLKALSLAPDYYPARNDLGTVYLQMGKFDAAREEFLHVLKSNANDPSAYFNLANVSLLTQEFQEGLQFAEQGLGKLPNSATGLFLRGCLDRRLGKFEEAERSLRDALQFDPSLANAHLELVNLYRQQENRQAVVAELQAFIKLFPNNPIVPRVKDALQRLQATPVVN